MLEVSGAKQKVEILEQHMPAQAKEISREKMEWLEIKLDVTNQLKKDFQDCCLAVNNNTIELKNWYTLHSVLELQSMPLSA